jgi:hypothetical protein
MVLLIVISCEAFACDTDGYRKIPIAQYERSLKISYPGEGLIDSNDVIRVFENRANSICFVLDTTRRSLNVCQIEGEAQKISENEFEYKDSTCHLIFSVYENKILLQVSGGVSKKGKNWCKHVSCGANGSVDSATFIKTTIPAPNR